MTAVQFQKSTYVWGDICCDTKTASETDDVAPPPSKQRRTSARKKKKHASNTSLKQMKVSHKTNLEEQAKNGKAKCKEAERKGNQSEQKEKKGQENQLKEDSSCYRAKVYSQLGVVYSNGLKKLAI